MGVVGFILVAGGALTVWAGFQGVNVVEVVRAVIAGDPLPRTTPAPAAPAPVATDDADAARKAEQAAKIKTPGKEK